MVDNHTPYNGSRNSEDIRNIVQYGSPYRKNSNDNFDYYRSSSSSCSSGSGKILVHRPCIPPYTTTSRHNPIFQEELVSPRSSALTMETDQNVGKFYIGGYLRPPTSPNVPRSAFYPPQTGNPELLAIPQFSGGETIPGKFSQTFQSDTRNAASPTKNNSVPESFWQIPRPNLWCSHKCYLKDGSNCSACELKEETTSNCSSENPPPTFTALDNIHPIKRRKKSCDCAISCLTTTTLCLLILSIITFYIVYVEIVIKRNQYSSEPM